MALSEQTTKSYISWIEKLYSQISGTGRLDTEIQAEGIFILTKVVNESESGVGSEQNDLTSSVTWDNIPNANVQEGAITQHQAALAIADTQLTPTGAVGQIMVDNGAGVYVPVTISGDAVMAEDGVMTVLAGASDAIIISAKVSEAGGITKGQVVNITGATGGFPSVSIADNTDFSKADVLAVAIESKSDSQQIIVTMLGLVEGIDTSAFAEGDVLYLSTNGAMTATHPTGIDAVQRMGHAVKINASTGSMLVEVDLLTIINDHDGTMRHQIINQNAGIASAASYTLVNNAGNRASFSIFGSNTFAPNAVTFFNEGHGLTAYTVAGNKPHIWLTDVTDSHDTISSTVKMWLSPEGFLGIGEDHEPTETLDVLGSFILRHTAVVDDDHAIEIDVNADGHGDVKALDVAYETGSIGEGCIEGVILLNINEADSTIGSEVFGLEVLTTTVGAAKVVGIKTGVGVDPIEQFSGEFANLTTILNAGADVLTELSQGGAGNISMFVSDNNIATLGSNAKFEEIEIVLGTASSVTIDPLYEYSTGIGTWAAFTPTDGTNGFRNTGVLLWDDSVIPLWAVGVGGEYLIRITRTRNNITTTPIVDLIQAAAGTIHKWDKEGNLIVKTIETSATPAYADDTAAGVGGLTAGQIYQTTGAGASPLNVAGIMMIKQ